MRLLKLYEKRKKKIKKRIEEFKELGNSSEEEIFAELCFCLCTPQSKAKICDRFIRAVKESGLLYTGSENEIKKYMRGIRFPNNKSKYIVHARKLFTESGKIKIKDKLSGDPKKVREWLVKNVKGMGMKEASHFLRNIGKGEELAILDRHILKNLKKLGVIKEIPSTLTKTKYLEIERKMKEFSKKIGIPLCELDLLLWSKETGEVFK